ncbi:HlyD family efflux transporter periplasmic adaptor subunit [Tepidibacter hydrothermalis]|uniref:HlyD family efflux transporter periplasmic adaptor subunit n=1 Tax=Tepidibacter hydrothermalis TaxID=3036126 RepID=A0ABY8EB56_9FIRM|nr:HlyD family efflux transporter periplasmic adaptor subunit [Tepidibacter hydrothermalis]WFD09130.1 HlyD family efflux transporter periplasmic adaptor subunit [Tepidibacter hydrothermalis]
MKKRKKRKKKRLKIKYNYLIILGVIIYIVAKLLNSMTSYTVQVETVKHGDLVESINKQGVIIKDEQVILSQAQGNIDYLAQEGKRVPKNKKIAEIQKGEVDLQKKEKLDTINRRIESIKFNRNEEILKSDIQKIDVTTKRLRDEIKTNIMNSDIESIQNLKEELLVAIDKKSLIWGEKSIVGKNIKTLESEKFKIENELNSSVQSVFANESGVISFNQDEYEDVLKVSSIDHLNSQYLSTVKNKEKMIKKNDEVEVGEAIGKIINNHLWYIAVVLDEKEASHLKIGANVKVEKNEQMFNASVKNLYKDENNKNILVLEVDEEKVDFYNERICDFNIIYRKVSGIKIPKNAVVTIGGKKGVYILSETGNSVFKELKSILGENNEYIVLDYLDIKKNRIDTIDLYDELIINPKNIKEGQKIR